MLFCLTLLTVSLNSFAFKLPKLDQQELNIHHIRMIKNAFIDFSKDIEKNNSYEESSFVQVQNFFLTVAYAEDGKCFFGGWPSRMQGEICKAPWSHGDDSWASNIQCIDPQSSKSASCNEVVNYRYSTCGSRGKFRCNPLLFGSDANGDGKCVETNGTYKKLTQKCVDQTKGSPELREGEKFLKDNPKLLEEYKNSVERFCIETHREDPEYDHNKTCDALRERLSDIVGTAKKDLAETVEGEEASVVYVNKALGILDKCQKDYSASKDGAISKFFSSRRNSLSQMVDYGKCSLEEVDTSITTEELDRLVSDFDDVSKETFPKEILQDSVNTGVELTLKNLMFTMDQFGEDINLEKVLKKYPYLNKSPYKQRVNSSIADFKKAKKSGALDKTKINKSEIVKNLNHFSDRINSLCQRINTEYTKRIKSRDSSKKIKSGMFMNSESEQNYYDQTQVEMTAMYQDFLDSDQMNISRLMATDHFKSDIFPFSSGLSEKCAEGDIDNIAFTPVGEEDISEAMEDYKELMLDELDDYDSMAKVRKYGDVEDGIHELIKYRPYLLGNTLKKNRNNPDLQNIYASYLCKESLDVYSSDELWRIGEVTAGGVGLVVSGALMATGIGSPLGVGLAAASGTLVAAEGAMAVSSYVDADQAADASSASFATESISMDQHISNNDSADRKKTEALVTGGVALIQPLAFLSKSAKTARTGLQVAKVSDEGSTTVKAAAYASDDVLRLTDESRAGTSVVKTASRATTKPKKSTRLSRRKEQKARAKARAQEKAQAKAKADADMKAKAQAKAKAEADMKAKAQAKAKADADMKAKAQAKAKADADMKAKAKADAKAKAQARSSASSSGEYKTKKDFANFIQKEFETVKTLPSEAVKGRTFRSIEGVKNVMKAITGKDYSKFTKQELRKEIKRLSTIFHPDKYHGKNDFFVNSVKDEMTIVNALKDAL